MEKKNISFKSVYKTDSHRSLFVKAEGSISDITV